MRQVKKMFNTLKHPLFKREIEQVRWSTLLLTLAILLPLLTILNRLYEDMAYDWRMETMDVLTDFPLDFLGWVVLPVLIISQFFYMRKDSVTGMIAALPFSRNEKLKHKYIAGILGILFAYSVSLLVLTATYYSAGRPILGPYYPILYWFIAAYLCSVLQYSFFFMIATIMGNSIFAGVGGFLIFYAPFFIVQSIVFNIDSFTRYYIDIEQAYKILLPHYISFTGGWYDLTHVPFSKMIPIIGMYILVSGVFFKLAQYFFDKNDFEYNGNMCMFVWSENVFLAGFTLCFGLLGMNFAQIFQYGWLYPLALIMGAACFPLGYILARKLLQITGHQLQFKKS